MNELAALETAMIEDKDFTAVWREHIPAIRFKKDAGNFVRRRRLLKREMARRIYGRIAAGERDTDKITEEVYESFATMLILEIVVKLLINAMVMFIKKRWTD